MAHYHGINGVAREIKKKYCGVSGISREVTKAYHGVNGVARPYFSSITPIGELSLGSSVYMNVAGSPREFILINNTAPESTDFYKYDSSCNGAWLLMKNIYAEMPWDSSGDAMSYVESDICKFLNDDFFLLFDEEIRSIIKTVKLPCEGYDTSRIKYYENAQLRVFLLSKNELICGWFESDSNYDYYRIATYNSQRTTWYCRDMTAGINDYDESTWHVLAEIIPESGVLNHGSPITITRGIRPAIVLPNETLVDGNFNIIMEE